MKYNRASLEDTVRVAKQLKRMSFVHATAYGYTIAKTAPPANQRYIKIDEKGNVFYHEPTFIVKTMGVIGTGYKPYIDKDKHEPETIAEHFFRLDND